MSEDHSASSPAETRLRQILAAIMAFRDGDFSVRCPRIGRARMGGLPRRSTRPSRMRIASRRVTRLSVTVGKEGRLKQRMSVARGDRRVGVEGRFLEHAARRSGAADDGRRARHRRGGQGRPRAIHGAGGGRAAPQGRVPPLGEARQLDDRATLGFHLGGHPRGPRGRHRGQARRTGEGQGRLGRVEGTHRVRQPDGRQPHRAGPQHRRRDHRRRQRRPFQEDHRRRARRNLAAQGSHQHDGGPAAVVRLGSDPRGPRGRHRRPPRRPGGGARRGGHVEGSHRLGQRDGDQPHRPGPQHRDRDHGGGARRPVAQDHRRREGRNSGTQGNHQHDGRSAQRLRLGSDPRGPRGRHRRQARRPGAGAAAWPAPGRISPTR